jgi:uncharacterized protein YqeY
VASDLKARIRSDLNEARKGRDKLRVLVLSTVLSDVRNKEIEIGEEVEDEGVLQVLTRGIKQRKDASEQMRAAGRGELADKEDEQSAVLVEYLPEGMSAEEVRTMVREIIESGVDQMGPLMGQLMPKIRGRFDGKEANRIVREELDARSTRHDEPRARGTRVRARTRAGRPPRFERRGPGPDRLLAPERRSRECRQGTRPSCRDDALR